VKKKLFVTLLVVAAFAGLTYVSAVADGKKTCDKKGKSCCAGIPESLKLTKEQKAKFEDIQDECKKVGIKTGADMKAARIDLNSLLKKNPIDKAAVDAKINEIAEQIKNAIKAKTDCKIKKLALLDADQMKAFLESGDCCDDMEHGEKDCCRKDGGKMGCETNGKMSHDMKGMGSEDKK